MSGALFPSRKPPLDESNGRKRRRSFDYLRRWLAGELSWRKKLASAELPPLVQETICGVVDQRKLTAKEKLSVTNELVAHFEDGYESGESYLTLLSEFGDAELTAALIRRAKERNRSMISAFMKVFGLMILLTAAGSALLAGLFTMREASPTVDYLPVFNRQAIEADESEKAWPIYRPLWIKHRFCQTQRPDPLFYANDKTDEYRMVKPGDSNWNAAVAFLDERADLVDAFRRGSQMPVFGFELKLSYDDYSDEDLQALAPTYWDRIVAGEIPRMNPIDLTDDQQRWESKAALVGMLLPHVQVMREAGRMFAVDTRRAVVENDSDRAIENVEATLGIARHAAEHPILVSALVGFACRQLAHQQVAELITENPGFLSDDQMAYLQELVAADDLHEFVNLDGEDAWFKDIIQQLFTDDGNGEGKMTMDGVRLCTGLLPGLTGLQSMPRDEFEKIKKILDIAMTDRKQTVEAHEKIMAIAKEHFLKPFYQQPLELQELVDEQGTNHFLIQAFMPAYDNVRAALEREIGTQDGVTLAIAVERFRLANDRLPESLEELMPAFITEIPLDRVTGQPLKFAVENDGPVIYSVGTDEVDQGGQPEIRDSGYRKQVMPFNFDENYKGDWVVWPINFQGN